MRRSTNLIFLGGLTVASWFTLAACADGRTSSSTTASAPTDTATAPPGPTTPATAPPIATATTPTMGAANLLGAWESASCDGRTYLRRITFVDATTFTAEDLVSPCPKGVECIWSGIVNRRGTYKIERGLVVLTVTTTGSGPRSGEFPASLTLDAGRGLMETGDGKACVYLHVGANKRP